MPEAATFTAATPRHALPLLFAGQAQKEFYVNECLARIDVLLHAAVEGALSAPPTEPATGACWIVAGGASGDWLGLEGYLAGWDGEQWTFVQPRPGMVLRNNGTGALLRYDGGWAGIVSPAAPAGGAVVDTEARATLSSLLNALTEFGIFSPPQ